MEIHKYTDYKKEQAFWLQRQNEKIANRVVNTEQFCIQKYVSYLRLIGYGNESFYQKIKDYHDSIGTYHLATGDDWYNTGYDEEIADNINELMDKAIKDHV